MDVSTLTRRIDVIEQRVPPTEVAVLVGLGLLRGHLAGAHRITRAAPWWLRWLHRHELAAVHKMVTSQLDELDALLRRAH